MNNEEHIKNEQKFVSALILFTIVIIIGLTYIIYLKNVIELKETKEAFNNSEIIVCYESLIISNISWKLIDDNLINNNIAGYLLIDNCKIKKD